MPTNSWLKALVLSLMCGLFTLAGTARAAAPAGGDEDFDEADAGALLDGDNVQTDYALLSRSCRCELRSWPGVEGSLPRDEKSTKPAPPTGWKWDESKKWLAPTAQAGAPATLTATLAIPATGKYRVWLRRQAASGVKGPVTLRLAGATTAEHLFGTSSLTSDTLKKQERQFNFSVEEKALRQTPALNPVWVWEYWDTALTAGATTCSILATSPEARITTLFLTASTSFIPSKSLATADNNLDKIYYRFRVLPGATGADTYTIPTTYVTFHWRFIPPKTTEPLWYSSLTAVPAGSKAAPGITGEDGKAPIAVGAWSSWVDATFCATASGPWFTLRPAFQGITDGEAEVQMAWFPHEAAVLKTIKPRIIGGSALLTAPAHHGGIDVPAPAAPDSPTWGLVHQRFIDNLRTISDIHADYLRWAREAIQKLGLPADAPRPRELCVEAPAGVAPEAAPATAEMFARLGINTSSDLPQAALQRNGMKRSLFIAYSDWGYLSETHDPCDPVIPQAVRRNLLNTREACQKTDPEFTADLRRIKLGDEIGPIVGAAMINTSSDCRAHFHAYLREILAEKKETPAFFGVANVDDLDYLEAPTAAPTRAEARLYYHCQLYKFRLTADYYRHTTTAAREIFPLATTYANFSPHPVTLGSQTMNGSEWFTLARQGGASMAWGEDWASGGSWGYNGLEIVSFLGAWVECAARQRQLPAGFYLVASCGAADHKMLSLLSRGIGINIYGASPIYNLAEASNSWSESAAAYEEVARGTYALGPADALLAKGRQARRQVALLYNRTDEIDSGGAYGMLCDRTLTFTALANGHHNADVILVEDLTATELAKYKILYINGFNLPAAAMAPLRQWVEAGGTLVGNAAVATRDEYNDPLPATVALFGAKQTYVRISRGRGWHPAGLKDHQPIGTLRLLESELTPALEAPLIGAKAVLTPTTGRAVGTFDDGTCAAVVNTLGKGRTLLYGFQPGILYKGGAEGYSTYCLDRQSLITKPAQAVLGAPAVDITAPQIELALFEHEAGLAVTLNNFASRRWQKDLPGTTLTVRTARPVTSVTSSFQGKLTWQREGDCIRITLAVPQHVEVVVLR